MRTVQDACIGTEGARETRGTLLAGSMVPLEPSGQGENSVTSSKMADS